MAVTLRFSAHLIRGTSQVHRMVSLLVHLRSIIPALAICSSLQMHTIGNRHKREGRVTTSVKGIATEVSLLVPRQKLCRACLHMDHELAA